MFFFFPELDFLQSVNILKEDDDSIKYTTGVDGLPCFLFGETAEVKEPARMSLQKLYRDFAIISTFRLDRSNAAFLFSVVNPENTLVQFGLHISEPDIHYEMQNITIYYSDFRYDESSNSLATFQVPVIVDKWTVLGIKVLDDEITLYMNCNEFLKTTKQRNTLELPFESGSTLYLAQGGKTFKDKFVVRINCSMQCKINLSFANAS